MAGNHSLWPDRYAEKLNWIVRVKEHPDCQPGCAVAMDRGDYDDGDTDEQFESKGIYDRTSLSKGIVMDAKRRQGRRQTSGDESAAGATGYPAFIHAPVPPVTLSSFVKPCFWRRLAAALDR